MTPLARPNRPTAPPQGSTGQREKPFAEIVGIVVDGVSQTFVRPPAVRWFRHGETESQKSVEVVNPLFRGDELWTGDNTQLKIRIADPETGEVDFIFLEPRSHVRIGSFCEITGRLLALV